MEVLEPVRFIEPNPTSPKDVNTVWFTPETEKNEAESEKQGFPVFDKILLAHIIGPGMSKSEATLVCERTKPDGTVVEYPAAKQRYGEMIKAYKSGEAGTLTGTPLTELAILDVALRATLRAMGIHSIEGLAAMNESAAPNLMGFRKFKTAAQAYIDQREGQAPVAKIAAELEATNEKYRALEANHADLLARLQALEDSGEVAPARRGPGRPPKMAAAA